jgi:Haem-binding domain
MSKRIKLILYSLLAVLILLQFVLRPIPNDSNVQTNHLSTRYPMPDTIRQIFKYACDDCHSNYTATTWYTPIQPVGWWMGNHVREGKEHLNVSEFTRLPIAVQNHKFEEIIETTQEGEMPMKSYTWLGRHPRARLSTEQRSLVTDWARTQMDSLKAQYPADSLVMPRRRRG